MTSNPSRFANVIPNMKRDDHEVLVLCCACYSERCGEQGYLSECLGFDNRVLYQKVAKELLSRLKSGKHTFGAINKGNIDLGMRSKRKRMVLLIWRCIAWRWMKDGIAWRWRV
eukprot:62319_1